MRRERALEIAASVCGVEIRDILARRRNTEMVLPRQACMWSLRERYGWSYLDLGRLFRRDHTTVMHGVQTASKRREEDEDFRVLTNTIVEALRSADRHRRVSVPRNVHPCVRRLFEIMREQRVTTGYLRAHSGHSPSSLFRWGRSPRTRPESPFALSRFHKSCPSIHALDDCLATLGYRLAVIPRESPPQFPAGLSTAPDEGDYAGH